MKLPSDAERFVSLSEKNAYIKSEYGNTIAA